MKPNELYPSHQNPYLIEPDRPLPDEMAVIGAGHIGPDIAYYLRKGLPDKKLYMVDVVEDQLKKAEERHKYYTEKGIEKKKLTPEMVAKILGNIIYTTDYNDIKNCALVIEAATENLDLKRKIFHRLEDVTSEDAILTSNTSGIPANEIFADLNHPERTTITHFFAPAWRSLPVEIINWERASDRLLNYLLWFFANTGKIPMMTANVNSFMLNRIFVNWSSEATFLLEKATSIQVDSVAEEIVASGPFFVLNFTGGNRIVYDSMKSRLNERACYNPSPSLISVDKWKVNQPGTKVNMPEDLKEWIRDRLLGLIFSQCFDIADRKIGTRSDLNLGSIIGLAFKKGVFEIMADLGKEEVKRIIENFDRERPGFPLPKHVIENYTSFPKDILVDDINGVKVISIRRPQVANSMSIHTCREIMTELKKGEKDPSTRGFIITGYGTKAFCAGADINGFLPVIGNYSAGMGLSRKNSKVIEYINTMKKPVVAALNGLAMGGGFELAMGCHSIVADKKAFFSLPEITLGLFPGMGGAVIPYRKWPNAHEKINAMITQAERLTSEEAHELGIVTGVADGYLNLIKYALNEVDRLIGRIPRIPDGTVDMPEFIPPVEPKAGDLPLSKEVMGILANAINEGAAADTFKKAMEISYKGVGLVSCIGALKEGVSAFLEKRKPNFTE
ncbi:MAG: 3-hydroxyacyl-CoA dehydrogenase/enoyl-CoA hydratase family protein [Desulfobacteraceae bacterium]|jgi:3-hydroxyacyl-CoA dehydrogenase/enoyl-CoA hydratase/carnithine racemase